MHADGSLAKYKARLCCHGGQQQWGVNFYETYTPVVSWAAVKAMVIMSKLHNLHTRSIDFILAYPQAEVKLVIYLCPPAGIILNINGEDVVLKLRKNLYGLKDAERTWWEHLSEGLEKIGFKPCNADQCVWIKDGIVVVVYVDNYLIFGNEEKDVEKPVQDLKSRLDITDEGKQ
eukprot:9331467-Ditylum_brightwellii.AAC.1